MSNPYIYPTPSGEVDGFSLAISAFGDRTLATATNPTTGEVISALGLLAPEDLAAVQNANDVDLSWMGAEGFGTWTEIQRRLAGGAWVILGHTADGAEDYTDEAPGAGEWEYRARAAPSSDLALSRSPYSNIASVTIYAPVLTVDPASGPLGTPTMVSWTSVPGATQYELEVASDSDFDTIVFSTTTASLSFAASIDVEGTLYLRVRSSQPTTGAWSNTGTLTGEAP